DMVKPMYSFVKQELEQIWNEESAIRSSREWLFYTDKVFNSKSRALWMSLFSCIENAVNEFNSGLGRSNHPKHIEFQETVPEGLLERRVMFPAVYVSAQLDKDDQSIRFTVERRVDQETPPTIENGRLRLVVLEDRELHFYKGERPLPQIEDAAQIILKPLFF